MKPFLFTCGLVLACLSTLLSVPGPAWAAASAPPVRRYVDAAATGGGDGTSWSTAYRALQDALDEANADAANAYEIWVAAGVYTPAVGTGRTPGDPAQSFRIERDGVQLFGGFAGGETDLAARDPAAHVTVLSGDVGGDDGTDADGVVTTTTAISGTNAANVVTIDATAGPITRDTVIDGVTLTAGHTPDEGASTLGGGGLYCAGVSHACSPTLRDVVFSGNLADRAGGGMLIVAVGSESSPLLVRVSFRANRAFSGGGLAIVVMSAAAAAPQLSDVAFVDNIADAYGGGLLNLGVLGPANPVLTDVTFSGNQAGASGGGMANSTTEDYPGRAALAVAHVVHDRTAEGQGVMPDGWASGIASPILTNVVFSGNRAGEDGGGLFSDGSGSISNPRLANVVFSGNLAQVGGGVWINGGHGVMALTNVTFSGNQAEVAGGAIASAGPSGDVSHLALTNGILWGDSPTEIFTETTAVTVTYSLVQGGFAGTGNPAGEGGLAPDPAFVRDPGPGADGTWGTADDDAGDLRVQSTSPAIDAGLNAAVPVSVTTDLDGHPRFVDIPVITDTGVGAPPLVDLGAYEWQGRPPVADAGPDQEVLPSAVVRLDATGSTDPDGDTSLMYAWIQLGGPGVTLNDATAAAPAFTAPGAPAVLTFTLSVTDSVGLPSLASDDVVITVAGYRIYLPLALR